MLQPTKSPTKQMLPMSPSLASLINLKREKVYSLDGMRRGWKQWICLNGGGQNQTQTVANSCLSQRSINFAVSTYVGWRTSDSRCRGVRDTQDKYLFALFVNRRRTVWENLFRYASCDQTCWNASSRIHTFQIFNLLIFFYFFFNEF